MTGNNDYSNPLARKSPLGGSAGVAIASLVPLIALFLIFGIGGGWSDS